MLPDINSDDGLVSWKKPSCEHKYTHPVTTYKGADLGWRW